MIRTGFTTGTCYEKTVSISTKVPGDLEVVGSNVGCTLLSFWSLLFNYLSYCVLGSCLDRKQYTVCPQGLGLGKWQMGVLGSILTMCINETRLQ
jgi:hypothetical protein